MPPKPPVARVGGPYQGVTGQSLTVDPTASTPSPGATLKSGTLGWGDGDTTTWTGKPALETHVYQAAGTFSLVLTVWDTKGRSAVGSTTASITVMPPTPLPPGTPIPPLPAAPTGLVATPGDAQITLTWTDIPNVTITIYRGTVNGGPYPTIVAVRSTAFGPLSPAYIDTGLTNATAYYYVITAGNATGTSGYSNQASATPVAVITAPAAPSNLAASLIVGGVRLTWQDNANNETSMQLERKLSSSSTYSLLQSLSANVVSTDDLMVQASTTYNYRIRALNGVVASGYSNSTTISVPAAIPAAPTNVQAFPGVTTVQLGWNASVGATSYAVKRATVNGGPYTQIISGLTTPTHTDTGLTSGVTYYYVITASNASGTSPNSSQVGATPQVPASLPVVPGAFGFGMDTRAAYGDVSSPTVLRVTNLNDSGAGSLRAALTASGPRVVIFETSGTIVLQTDIAITNPYLTVAGQTAPSPGITIRGAAGASASAGGINIFTHDVLLQHLRIRPGDGGPVLLSTAAHNALLIGYAGDTYNVVIDHCSCSWSGGKNIQVAYPTTSPGNITLWRNISSEGLYRAANVTDNWAGGQTSSFGMHLVLRQGTQLSAIGNLLAHSSDRNPETGDGARIHFINNVVYDWGKDENPYQWASFFYQGTSGTDPWKADFIGNKYIAGPPPHPFTPLYAIGTWNGDPGSEIYISDNARDQTQQTVNEYDNHLGYDPRVGSPPVSLTGITVQASSGIETFVLTTAGARPADRDAVDTRIISEVTDRTGDVISSQNEVGGWPALAANTRGLTTPASPHTVQVSGYTALEEWLHGYAVGVGG